TMDIKRCETMKSDPESYLENTLPYWADQKTQLPLALQSVVAQLGFVSSNPWLVFPFERVGSEPYQEYALRLHGKQLEIAFAIPHEGHEIIRIDPTQCESVDFETVLLYSEITFTMKNGSRFTMHYNAVGDRKLRHVMSAFLEEMAEPELSSTASAAWSP